MLLFIITARRKQTIILIKIENIIKTNERYEIKIPDRVKTTRLGAYQPLILVPRFEKNSKFVLL